MNMPDDPRHEDVSEDIGGTPDTPPITAETPEEPLDLDDTRLLDPITDEPADIVIVEVPPEPPRTVRPWALVVASLVSVLVGAALAVGALAAWGLFDRLDRVEDQVEEALEPDPVPELPRENVVADVAQKVIPSIVTVQRVEADIPIGSGSGVVYTDDGYILTNEHVIAGGSDLKVVFSDGLAYNAQLIGSDPLMDVAMLKIDADGLSPVDLADISVASIGDLAIAVGNPLGLDGGPSVTSGVISAFDRTLSTNGLGGPGQLYGLVQTDAPITRGSSGGALLNENAQLLGITTAIGVTDVGAVGLGFAVPVDLLVPIAQDLIDNGSVAHAFLGIEGRSAVVVRSDGSESPIGAEIRRLLDNSAIGGAGAEAGDIIVALDGERVNSMILLVARLRGYRAGDEITVTLNRGGDDVDVTLVLDQYPNS